MNTEKDYLLWPKDKLVSALISWMNAHQAAEAKVAKREAHITSLAESITEFTAKVAALEKELAELRTPLKDWDKKLTEKNAALSKRNAEVAALSKDLARAREALIAIRQGHESNEVDYMRDERIIGKAFASIPAPEAPSESPSVCSAHQTKDKDCPRCAISFNPSESVGGVCGVDEPCHCEMFGLPKHDAPDSAAGEPCVHAAPSEPRFYMPCPKCGHCSPDIAPDSADGAGEDVG